MIMADLKPYCRPLSDWEVDQAYVDWDGGAGESDRCIKACGLARCEGGVWSCPLFAVGVDKVSIINERGVMCRRFERRDA